jgi:hypothetical protein
MLEPRANASSLVYEGSDYLYAFGGYNSNQHSSAVVCSIERINTKRMGEGWHFINVKWNSEVKACNYMHFISIDEIMVFGGWLHGVTSKAIDHLNLNELEFSSWTQDGIAVNL